MESGHHDDASAVEQYIGRRIDPDAGQGRAFSDRVRQYQRSVEAYLLAGGIPRWMERAAEIDRGVERAMRDVGDAYRELRSACAGDAAAFAERWTARAHAWRFSELNDLIEQHNEWYPVERRLPMHPRTGEYVLVGGRSYRRTPLGPEWILERFPAKA